MIDEPEIRGGKGTGPTPLGYFFTGAASCLMMQYANVLKEKPRPVESVKMLARAHNDREARVFTDMIYQVDLTGSLSEADAETLTKAASERCFGENTQVATESERKEGSCRLRAIAKSAVHRMKMKELR